jgi:hypothetical protein
VWDIFEDATRNVDALEEGIAQGGGSASPSTAEHALMEARVLASYATVLVGCLLRDPAAQEAILRRCPSRCLALPISWMEQFVQFNNRNGLVTEYSRKALEQVLERFRAVEAANCKAERCTVRDAR